MSPVPTSYSQKQPYVHLSRETQRQREMKREAEGGPQFPTICSIREAVQRTQMALDLWSQQRVCLLLLTLEVLQLALCTPSHPESPGCSAGSYHSDRLWGSLCHCHGSKLLLQLTSQTFIFSHFSLLPTFSPREFTPIHSCLRVLGNPNIFEI